MKTTIVLIAAMLSCLVFGQTAGSNRDWSAPGNCRPPIAAESAAWAEPTDHLSAPLPATGRDWLEPGIGASPPHWIPKQPGHYSLTDWRRVIDSTWGPGLPVVEKLNIFDAFWYTIDEGFACFNNITVNWDSLRTVYRSEIEDTVSRGRFAAIMNHLAMALREAHTVVFDIIVNMGTPLTPGVPLWVVGGWRLQQHFGAGLTPLPDSSLLVYRVVNDHPLGLQPGDVVLGYDRRPWVDILRGLQEAQLPMVPLRWGSCSSAVTYSLLNAAGANWHLFDTIDIVKYATGDTMHLPTSLLVGDRTRLFATDQMEIPGVPMPDPENMPAVTFGVVSGTRIGYIYVWRWSPESRLDFQIAVNRLVSDTTLKGMILDFRYNEGGSITVSNPGLELLFRDSVATVCFSQRRDDANHLSMKVVYPESIYVIPGNGIGYDKPIAVLVGPGAVGAGDQVAYRMRFHPRVRTFGKPTNGAFSEPVGLSMPTWWYARYAVGEACMASDTTYFLTRREFPVDVPVWHTPSAVARGEDTVVTAAMAWIDSMAAAVVEMPNAEVRPTSVGPTVVRGVLFLAKASSRELQAASLLDVGGRKVMGLRPGANDVSRLPPGVYFVRDAAGGERPGTGVRRMVVAR